MCQIAIEGCLHGELTKVYNTLKMSEEKNNIKIDFVLICGDFQVKCYIKNHNKSVLVIKKWIWYA